MDYSKLWLDYRKISDPDIGIEAFSSIYYTRKGKVMATAVKELDAAIKASYDIEPLCKEAEPNQSENGIKGVVLLLNETDSCSCTEAYNVKVLFSEKRIVVSSAGESGILYGVFSLIRRIQTDQPLKGWSESQTPSNHLRMLNHWDNMDGSIERGYSGRSFFFANDTVLVNERTRAYARILASIGINATVINNVNVKNAATWLITDRYFKQLKQMAEIFEEYGVKLFLCVNYASSIDLGGLDTADPLDKAVQEWWQHKSKEVFDNIPNVGGFVIKADSEGRPGPFTYGRTQADGANMLARAVKPYGGIIIWRCFVYNCNQDWRDRVTDRARAQYDYFKELDGQFDENVILQIKNGPMDFQVREPVSPLFGGLKSTNQMLEVQIAQEYTGQQVHVCYLIPWFKEVLSFHTYLQNNTDTVADIIGGRTLGNKLGGFVAVANTGSDYNWTGHDLAAANLYGFGRLSFNTELKADEIASEWTAQTFGTDEQTLDNIVKILMMSWPAYEKYNAPLGIGWMCNPSHHYGPNVDGYEYDRWGTYHRADHFGIGVDRTDTGTGYARQYNSPNYEMYNNPESCPDELVLFFHHLPYDHVLKSGKTVLQHIYDTHFEGVNDVEEMIRLWNELEDNIELEAYKRVSKRLYLQLENAKEWRDVVNSYFYRKTAIPDEKERKIY